MHCRSCVLTVILRMVNNMSTEVLEKFNEGQVRILRALVQAETREHRTPGINWAELSHLLNQLTEIEMVVSGGHGNLALVYGEVHFGGE